MAGLAQRNLAAPAWLAGADSDSFAASRMATAMGCMSARAREMGIIGKQATIAAGHASSDAGPSKRKVRAVLGHPILKARRTDILDLDTRRSRLAEIQGFGGLPGNIHDAIAANGPRSLTRTIIE